jgi:cysteine-rich repeat protein
MSWSSPVRVLGVCGLWLALLTGCGGNPDVPVGTGGSSNGGSSGSSRGGSSGSGGLMIGMGGDGPNGEGGEENPNTAVCGNQELEPGEFCEDGNTTDDDGCSADCSVTDPDYDCSKVGEP